jgi:hypothetical protein
VVHGSARQKRHGKEIDMRNRSRNARMLVASITFAGLLGFGAGTAAAIDTTYPPDGDHPLRLVYYFVAPVGEVLEWTVTRPLAIFGNTVAPYEHINKPRAFRGCSRERPARSCTDVVR